MASQTALKIKLGSILMKLGYGGQVIYPLFIYIVREWKKNQVKMDVVIIPCKASL